MPGRPILRRLLLCFLVGFEVRRVQATAAQSAPQSTVAATAASLPLLSTGSSLGLSPAAATPWEATRTERSSRERPGSGLGWSPSLGLVPEPRPSPHVVGGGQVAGGGVVFSSSSTGVGGEPPSRPSAYWDDPHFRPHFDNSTDRNVTAQLGKSAFLHCRIRQLGDRTVSWVRQRDLHILTVGTYTYTSDQRFHSIHLEGTEDWTLEVRYTQKWDAGVYECQVSTEPKMSLNISLAVVVAKARIPEGSNLYIQSGNTINLTCVVTDSRAPPVYVFWYHDDRMINYDSARRAGIRVATERGPSTTVSRLQVPDASMGDSGNYSCIPSYADPANITVHVLNGEKPAAMQHGRQGNIAERSLSSLLLVTGVLLSHRLFTHAVVQR